MRFRFIVVQKAWHTVTILCRCLQVTPSGFYAWRRRPESTHTCDDRRLKVLVGLFPFFYGARKVAWASMGLGLVDDATR